MTPLVALLHGGCASTWTLDDGVLGRPSSDCPAPVSIYQDVDQDGFGDPQAFLGRGCTPATGEAANALDCDDTDAAVNPGAVEVCNGVDDDCDTEPEDTDAEDATVWYLDG
ncbi:MAG: putative metal-binding motif-containing protein, partial [Myxococcota bacterium]|nr:putative metal-binding motif-containing protein [Myxococcota bacterium]